MDQQNFQNYPYSYSSGSNFSSSLESGAFLNSEINSSPLILEALNSFTDLLQPLEELQEDPWKEQRQDNEEKVPKYVGSLQSIPETTEYRVTEHAVVHTPIQGRKKRAMTESYSPMSPMIYHVPNLRFPEQLLHSPPASDYGSPVFNRPIDPMLPFSNHLTESRTGPFPQQPSTPFNSMLFLETRQKKGRRKTISSSHFVSQELKEQQQHQQSNDQQFYFCPFPDCNKVFSRFYNLKSHQRTHTGERPYICDHEGCGAAFGRNHDLKRHKRVHTGDRPYVCEFCKKNFSRLDALNRHLKVAPRMGENTPYCNGMI